MNLLRGHSKEKENDKQKEGEKVFVVSNGKKVEVPICTPLWAKKISITIKKEGVLSTYVPQLFQSFRWDDYGSEEEEEFVCDGWAVIQLTPTEDVGNCDNLFFGISDAEWFCDDNPIDEESIPEDVPDDVDWAEDDDKIDWITEEFIPTLIRQGLILTPIDGAKLSVGESEGWIVEIKTKEGVRRGLLGRDFFYDGTYYFFYCPALSEGVVFVKTPNTRGINKSIKFVFGVWDTEKHSESENHSSVKPPITEMPEIEY